ncbi:MAG: glycosyltransferase [Phycisphaeraceae bacterium]|nr:glycosyltransferase [Phycisphaeraceae bacterium]
MTADELTLIRDAPLSGNIKRVLKRLARPLGLKLGVYGQHRPIPFRPDPELLSEQSSKQSLEAALIDPPLISVVTPSFNQGRWLRGAIESVTGQRYPRLEYVVIDGGSTDNSIDVLRSAAGITRWISEPDRGQADGINKGFALTSGEIMAWLNSDDLFLPGAFRYVARWFREHPEVDVVYGNRIIIDTNGDEVGRWVLPPHRSAAYLWRQYIPQETLFWRRSLWNRTGARVNTEFDFLIDWELILRFHHAGAKFCRLPRTLGAFRTHPLQKSVRVAHSVGKREVDRLRAPLDRTRRLWYRIDNLAYVLESVAQSWARSFADRIARKRT